MSFTKAPGRDKAKLPKNSEVDRIEFQAPWPPTVNRYWKRNANGGMRIGTAGLLYRNLVLIACLGLGKITGKCAVTIRAYPPDRMRHKLDNILKALLDAIVKAGAIDDDSDIDHLTIVRGSVDEDGNGIIFVEIDGL